MSIISFNNTSSIIPQTSKSAALFHKTEELPTLSKINLVISVQILRADGEIVKTQPGHFICKDASSLRFFRCNLNGVPKLLKLNFFKARTRQNK